MHERPKMSDTYVFAVDVGTSSLKAAIIDRGLTLVEYTQEFYSYTIYGQYGGRN